jgi:hypothetical protein
MTKMQSFLDEALDMVTDLEEFEKSGSKEGFRKQLREEFVRRSGAASLDEALATAMTSLLCETLGTSGQRSGIWKVEGPSAQNGGVLFDARCQSAVGEGLASARPVRYLPVDGWR